MNENEICRTCLNKHDQFFNIFTHYTCEKLISDTLMEYTLIQIEQNDELPVNICQTCFEKLNFCNQFKSMIVESDRILRSSNYKLNKYINNLNNCNVPDFIKEESSIEDNILNHEAEKVNFEFVENVENKLCIKLINSNGVTVENEKKSKKGDENNERYYCKPCKKSYKTLKRYEIHCNKHKFMNYEKNTGDDYNIPVESYVKIECTDKNNGVNPDENIKKDLCSTEQKEMIKCNKIKGNKKARNYCAECDKTFRNSYRFKIHNTKHNGIKPFKCKDCHKCFAQQWVLNIHSRVHTGIQPYSCEICGKKFKFMSALPNHMRTHTGDQPYKCEVCNKSFSQMGAVKVHMRTHTGEKPYICEICGKSFAESARLTRHISTHDSDKTYPCPICGKLFSNELYVKNHQKTHTNTKPFSCEICDKRFTIRASLNTHMLIHRGEKPHSCQICGKRFTQLSCIGRHMRIHTGQTPYPCTECPRSFKYSHHLLNHMKSHKQSE